MTSCADLADLPMPRVTMPAGFTVYFNKDGQPILHAHLRVASLLDADDEDLPDGLERNPEGRLVFECVACGRRGCEWDAPASEFDSDNRDHRLGTCGPHCTP